MSADDLTTFLPFCSAAGITWHDNLRLTLTEGEGGGVFAAGPIAAGEVAISVPRAAALAAPASEIAASLGSKHALALAAWEAKSAATNLAPWVALWPKITEGSWSLDGQAKSALNWCTELHRLDSQEGSAASRALSEVIVPRLQASGHVVPSAGEYQWGLGVVSSRAADVMISGEARPTLLPLIDMMNHRGKAEASLALAFEPATDCVVARVVSPAGLQAGDPLTICYGEKDNAHLLHGYGFACRPNPNDTVLVRVPVGNCVSDPLAMQRAAMLPRGALDDQAMDPGGGGGDLAAWGMLTWCKVGRGAGKAQEPVPKLSADLQVLLSMASAASVEQMFAAMTMAAMAGGDVGDGGDVQTEGEVGGEVGGGKLASEAFDPSTLSASAWELLATCCAAALAALPPPKPAEAPASEEPPIVRAAAVALEARRDLLQASLSAAKVAAAAAATPTMS